MIIFLCFFVEFKSIYKSFLWLIHGFARKWVGNLLFEEVFTRVTSLSALFNPWKWCNGQGKLLQFFIFFTFPFYINFLTLKFFNVKISLFIQTLEQKTRIKILGVGFGRVSERFEQNVRIFDLLISSFIFLLRLVSNKLGDLW